MPPVRYLVEFNFGTGELGPYVAPGSGAETDRSASRTSYQAGAAQKQSQQRSAHSSRAEAAKPQQSSSMLNKQTGVYVLQGQKGTNAALCDLSAMLFLLLLKVAVAPSRSSSVLLGSRTVL